MDRQTDGQTDRHTYIHSGLYMYIYIYIFIVSIGSCLSDSCPSLFLALKCRAGPWRGCGRECCANFSTCAATTANAACAAATSPTSGVAWVASCCLVWQQEGAFWLGDDNGFRLCISSQHIKWSSIDSACNFGQVQANLSQLIPPFVTTGSALPWWHGSGRREEDAANPAGSLQSRFLHEDAVEITWRSGGALTRALSMKTIFKLPKTYYIWYIGSLVPIHLSHTYTHGWMGGWMDGWVDGWMDGWI